MSDADTASGAAYAGRDANHALGFRQFSASKHAQYFTPLWLADLLFELLAPLTADGAVKTLSVLDPTCGSARLLAPWHAAGASVLGIELDKLAAEHAQYAIGRTNVRTGDILDYRNLLRNFSLVLTNPPYGLWWTASEDEDAWACKTSGGKLESQSATIEIAFQALAYGGLLVAILPSSTFANAKDRFLRETFYREFTGLLHLTLGTIFGEEYGIDAHVDLVVARKTLPASWDPLRAEIDGENPADQIRDAFRRALRDQTLRGTTADPVPMLSRLVAVTPSRAVRMKAKGLGCAADTLGLLGFLDETVTAFDPVRGIEHGIVSAALSPASILTLGSEAGEATLARLGFSTSIAERDKRKIARLGERYALWRTPLYPPRPHQRLAYLEDRSYPAKATVADADGVPCFTVGRSYHLRPSWVRNRETAKIENVFDEREGKEVTLVTSVDRGYLSFSVVTDSGPRTFREVDAREVELLTTAFELPEVPDLETRVPERLAQHRAAVAKGSPFLFPFQAEDVARMAVKPFGYLGYEQGGGKTVTAASWARTRGFRRVLVVCPAGLIDNWLHELASFGFVAQRLTTHAAIAALEADKRAKRLPSETTFYVTSFEFLSLTGARRYDPWTCVRHTKNGLVDHEETDITKAACPRCKRKYEDVVTACPRCGDGKPWSGGHCRNCSYQAWSATGESRQWPAYKRMKKLFGAVLVDEAQIAKSKNTLRGRAVRALRPKGRLILTGTLMKGYAHDLFWNVAWLLGFDTPLFPYAYRGGSGRFLSEFGTYEFVTRQFEDTLHEGRAKLLPEVSNLNRMWRLLASFAIRRRKDDIYVLPPKNRQIVLLPMDERHRPFYGSYAEWAKTTIAKALRENEEAPNMGVISGALWKLRYAASCPVARDYLDPALEVESWNKLDYILRYIRAAKARGERTIVFSGLRTMVAAIVRHLRRNGIVVLPITAEVPARKRFGLIGEFTARREIDCIVASLNCLNRGHTIVAANHVLISDLEYSPEATEQAEDRVHRPGQTREVFVKVLLSADSIDGVMWEIVTQKSEAIRHAIDGQARFTDVAEILHNATGDVRMEIARRIDLLPVPTVLHEAPATMQTEDLPADLVLNGPELAIFVSRPIPATVTQLSLFDSTSGK